MNNKIKLVINILLLITLLTLTSTYLIIFNIKNGITKQDIKQYIDKIDITKELKKTDLYDEIRNKTNINKETIDKIINSNNIEQYIKNNTQDIFISIIYEQNIPNINTQDIKNIIETNIDKLIENKQIELTEQQKQQLLELTNEYSHIIEEGIKNLETYKQEINIVKNIIFKTIPQILLVLIISIIGTLILLNKNTYSYLLYIGIPCIIIGITYIISFITLKGITNSFTNFQNLILKTGIIGVSIGLIQIIIYTKIERKSEQNGENGLI